MSPSLVEIEGHIERREGAAADLTALDNILGLAEGYYVSKNIREAAEALGVPESEIRERLRKGEVITWSKETADQVFSWF